MSGPPRTAARAARAATWLLPALLALALAGAAAAPPSRAAAAPSGGGAADPPAARGPSTLSPVRAVAQGPEDPLANAGSRSIGLPDHGFLVGGVELPVEGDGYRVLPRFRERHLHFGTAELVAAVQRAARVVRERFPDAVLQLGNLSGRYGGEIRYSRSHESGRDVDVVFFATDAFARPVLPESLVRYRCDLRSRGGDPPAWFDLPRNWALLEAVLSDPDVDVQLIFVSSCLRRALLRHAEEAGADPALRQRAALALRGPSRGSYDHDDHFHIRVYCTRADLLTGCRYDGPIRPWARVHADVLAADDAALAAALRAPDAAERVRALRRVAALDRKGLDDAALRLLDDPDADVRAAALAAAAALATPSALRVVHRRLTAERDPATALALLAALRAFEPPAPETAALLAAVADDPGVALGAPFSPEERTTARVRACEALALLGGRRTPEALLPLLEDPSPAVRGAAESALSWLTNHAERLAADAPPAERRTAWRAWWEKARHLRPDRRLWEGFRAAGVELPEALHRGAAVVPLVSLIPRGGHLSWNAQQLLRHFAAELAPRIPHDRPEQAFEVWRAWLGSRLPAGALDAALDGAVTVQAPAP